MDLRIPSWLHGLHIMINNYNKYNILRNNFIKITNIKNKNKNKNVKY